MHDRKSVMWSWPGYLIVENNLIIFYIYIILSLVKTQVKVMHLHDLADGESKTLTRETSLRALRKYSYRDLVPTFRPYSLGGQGLAHSKTLSCTRLRESRVGVEKWLNRHKSTLISTRGGMIGYDFEKWVERNCSVVVVDNVATISGIGHETDLEETEPTSGYMLEALCSTSNDDFD